MPLKSEQFTIVQDDFQKIIDIDASDGRSVPINMNFIDEGYLTKDTGMELFGAVEASLCHSLFNYVKKDGTNYILRGKGTKLQLYNTGTGVWDNLAPAFTEGAEFGFKVYDDVLYLCNAVEAYQKWDGTTFTTYASAPKGNILEIFEDRMFVAGVTAEPLTTYYSNVGNATTFTVTDLVKPLGTDSLTNLKNYYGSLLVFKADSIWKITFVYDPVVTLFVPKLEQQSGTYGACSRKAVAWVENDIWFFTGTEVRAIGFTDNISGIFGINKTVLSENIKETLKLIDIANLGNVVVFYENRRFYLGVPISTDTVDTVFVCHTLYKNSWTKYTDREKAKVNDFMVVDGLVYSTKSVTDFGVVKWNTTLNDISTAISSEVTFQRLEDKEFNRFRTYRYLDLKFKDLTSTVTVSLKKEASNLEDSITKDFSLGTGTAGETVGELEFGDALFGGGVGAEIEFSPFIKKRVSFLSKNQAFLVSVSNNNVDETFTLAEFALSGKEQPKKLYSGRQIISMS